MYLVTFHHCDYGARQIFIPNSAFEIKHKNEPSNANLLTKIFYLLVYYLLLKIGEEGEESEKEILRE